MVLNNAALSLYTQLSSAILQRHPHLFDQAMRLFQEQKAMMTLPSTTAADTAATAATASHTSPSSMHSSAYVTMIACAGRSHRREVTH